ncbi:MAG: ATP-binding protein [Actinomycetota bacterium]
MATVELKFSARTAHVRTVRQVAVSLARRSGVDEQSLEEVRLAVGEACGLVVALHERYCPDAPVAVALEDSAGLTVSIRSDVALTPARGRDAVEVVSAAAGQESGELPAAASLAVVWELVPRLDLITSEDGVSLTMAWPAGRPGGG